MARSATARISGVSKVDNRPVEVGPGGGLLFQIASKTPPLINGNFRTLKCKLISPQNMALYGTVPPFLDPGIPIDIMGV